MPPTCSVQSLTVVRVSNRLSVCLGEGVGGGGAQPGRQVSRARDHAGSRGPALFLTSREPDVPPVGR